METYRVTFRIRIVRRQLGSRERPAAIRCHSRLRKALGVSNRWKVRLDVRRNVDRRRRRIRRSAAAVASAI